MESTLQTKTLPSIVSTKTKNDLVNNVFQTSQILTPMIH